MLVIVQLMVESRNWFDQGWLLHRGGLHGSKLAMGAAKNYFFGGQAT